MALISCDSKNNKEQIKKSYSIIGASNSISESSHKKLNDVFMDVLNKIEIDNNAKFDIRKIKIILDSARFTNKLQIATVENVAEIDDKIKLKEKYLNCLKLLDTLYKINFPQFIDILDSKANNKIELISNTIVNKLQDLERLKAAEQNARRQVEIKYNLQ